MKYHNITKADMLNGEGLRVVLWTSGCSHHCQACHNAITWNKDSGLDFDDAAKKEIFDELEKTWCSGLTLSGGDPLFIESREEISKLVIEVKNRFPDKTIWCYTGYTWETLLEQAKTDDNLKNIVKLEINKFNNRLNNIEYNIVYTDDVVDYIHVEAIKKKEFGARPIIRLIQDNIEDKITELMLEHEYQPNYTFSASCENDEIVIS